MTLVGDLRQALGDCDQSLRLKPNDPNALDSRGLVFLKLGRLDDAIADYGAALELKPKLASSLYGRGLAKQKKGDGAGGDADIAAARAIQSDIAERFSKWGPPLTSSVRAGDAAAGAIVFRICAPCHAVGLGAR